MTISFAAPALTQASDEELLVAMGAIIFPGFVERPKDENGLRLHVEGPLDSTSATAAAAKFQTLLGAIRVFRSDAGELVEEQRPGLGQGAVLDEFGNQYVTVGTVIARVHMGGEIERFANDVRAAIEDSQSLRNALWLNGRPHRTAADLYMIYEYAKVEFGGVDGVRDTLGISKADQERLTVAANNLSPLEGGRHAVETDSTRWSLGQQRDFVVGLLRAWIRHGASNRPANI